MSRTHFVGLCFLALVLQVSAQSNPVPFLNAPLVPAAKPPGSPSFTLTINGTGFISGATVDWNQTPLVTTFVSSSQLTAIISAPIVAAAGTFAVTVKNPAPGGGTSNTQTFEVTTPVVAPTFTNVAELSTLEGSTALAADVNGDGKVDLIAGNYNSGGGSLGDLCVLLGDGDGSFQPASCSTYGGASWTFLTATDVNNDGFLDVIAIDSMSNLVNIFLGKGDGSFQSPSTFNCCTRPSFVSTGDFNSDGKLDLAVSDSGSTDLASAQVAIMLGNGDGTFTSAGIYFPGAIAVRMLAVGDFNDDGKLDVAFENITTSSSPLGNIDFLLGNGDGTFHLGTEVAGFGGQGLFVADMNGDGNLDLVANNPLVFDVTDVPILYVASGNGDGTFQTPVQNGGGDGVLFGLADFNGDGTPDLLSGEFDSNGHSDPSWSLYLGNPNGTLQPALQVFGGSLLPYITAIGDFNNDGHLDFTAGSDLVLQGSFPTSSFFPTSGTFNEPVGITSPPVSFTVTNKGTVNLLFTAHQITGTNAADFAIQNVTCSGSIAPNATCYINVTFAPLAGGIRTANLTISDNAVGSPQTVPLTGSAQDFTMSISPTTVTVAPGQTATYNLTVTPLGGFNHGVFLSCTGLPKAAGCILPGIGLDGINPVSTSFTIITGTSTPPGTYPITFTGSYPSASLTHTLPITLVVNPLGIRVVPATGTPTTATVSAGAAATFALNATASNFNGTVSLSCGVSPVVNVGPTCTVPSSVDVSSGSAAFNLTVSTTAPTLTSSAAVLPRSRNSVLPIFTGGWLVLILAQLQRSRRYALRALFPMILVLFMLGCSGGGSSSHTTGGTPAGTYAVTVTADVSGVTSSTTVNVTVQ